MNIQKAKYETVYQSPNWDKRLREWCKENRKAKAKAKKQKGKK